MLAVEGLTKRFGGFLAVNQVSFEARQGEILGLIGPNGSGKSTTFNLIAGALRPSAGSVRFEGAEITGLAAYKVCRQGIARTFQIPRPFRKLSLIENVTLAAYYGEAGAGGISRAEALNRAEEALGLVGLPIDPSATTNGLGAAALKNSSSPARSPPGQNSCSPTKASAGSTPPKWSMPPICSNASAPAWASPSSGSSTSWAC